MDAVSTEKKTTVENEIAVLPGTNGANGQPAPADPGWPVPDFKHNLGDNPLWPDFLNELKAQREADIAESNRLADLELEQEKLEK